MEISIRNLQHSYNGESVIKNIDLSLKKGEFVSIIGPSGCGKSTLFNLITGLEVPDEGDILFDGKNMLGKRGHSSYMMQKDLLFPWKTVLENVLLGPTITKQEAQEAVEEARSLFPMFGLEGYEHYYPEVLSGGMKQRAALLRTFLHKKELMLLDEPFGALDALTREKMHSWLLDIWSHMQRTVLFITHSIDEAIFLSDRIYVFGPRPTEVILDVKVPLPRPRNKEMTVTPEYLEVKQQLMNALYEMN
ncbi:hydroxymethylpyrimidine ABC transporter [Halalkalibacter wakoensis JCM 9140]|uniref:Hydroxymethylpyrimidine ABC transporter n=1 Tax=Halalkalibacter wakoensis JCM 9140 TaxID=1236970 RepID=W4Q1J4_9BACI|nr:ABC transporter ATP-binding protein [Halalkalibacter wakoensis]GAE25593.1 hydroxymethylpyrimidine ABC transporter [Halalkalibacter wakoensis JCM 9140]